MSSIHYPSLSLHTFGVVGCCLTHPEDCVLFNRAKNRFYTSSRLEMHPLEQTEMARNVFENTVRARFHHPSIMELGEFFDDGTETNPLTHSMFEHIVDRAYEKTKANGMPKSEIASMIVPKLYMVCENDERKEVSKELLMEMLRMKMPGRLSSKIAEFANIIKFRIRDIYSNSSGNPNVFERHVWQLMQKLAVEQGNEGRSQVSPNNINNTILLDANKIYCQFDDGTVKELSDEMILEWVKELGLLRDSEESVLELRCYLLDHMRESSIFCLSEHYVDRAIRRFFGAKNHGSVVSGSSLSGVSDRPSLERELTLDNQDVLTSVDSMVVLKK